MHRFQYNQVLPFAGNDVRVISPLEGAEVIQWGGFWKGDPDFILVFNNNHTSNMHSFRCNQVFPLAGNDVIVLSPKRSAVAGLNVQILKGRPQLNSV